LVLFFPTNKVERITCGDLSQFWQMLRRDAVAQHREV